MEKGYIENGFIVDLSHTKKISEIIYELSRVLDMPESKGKHICLKLGAVDLSENELKSVKALIELMESELAYISTGSSITLESAATLEIKVSEFSEQISAPSFDTQPSEEVSNALDNIFGENTENNEPHQENDDSDGNVLIIGDVNPGAEIIAKGDITVWGVLGGIAYAGSECNNYAKIRALKLNPVQIRIGEVLARRPDTVNLPYIQRTSEYTPEEAYTQNGSIIIKKIHEEN